MDYEYRTLAEWCWEYKTQVKTKQTCTGLGSPWGFQEFEAPRISKHSAHEGGAFVSPTHRPLLPPAPQEIFLELISLRDWVDPKAIVGRKDYVNK